MENQEEEKEPSTSFCPNCVKLKRRIQELEDELSRVKGEQADVVGPSMSGETQNDHDPPHPEQGPIEHVQGRDLGKLVVGPDVKDHGEVRDYQVTVSLSLQ